MERGSLSERERKTRESGPRSDYAFDPSKTSRGGAPRLATGNKGPLLRATGRSTWGGEMLERNTVNVKRASSPTVAWRAKQKGTRERQTGS